MNSFNGFRRFLKRYGGYAVSIFSIVCLMFVTSCGEDPVDPNDPPAPLLEIRNELPRFSPSGGSANLVFDSNLPWNITLEPSEGWYSVSSDSGDAGENILVTITAEPNESYEDRAFTLTLSNNALQKQMTITQSHKNVILVGENTYNVTYEKQTIIVEVQSNVEYEISITNGADWISEVPQTKALTTESHSFEISENTSKEERTGTIRFKDSKSKLYDVLTVCQSVYVDPTPDLTALNALYKSAGGNGWTNNTNWCTDKPLSEWYGVETDEEGRVTALRLSRNNLLGTLPVQISGMSRLQHIDLSHNGLSGKLPSSWSELSEISLIDISSNNLTGRIPDSWGAMFENGRCVDVIVYNNNMGDGSDFAPYAMQTHPEWNRLAFQIARQRSGGLIYLYYMPDMTLTSVDDDSQYSMRDIYSNNKYTMIFNWDPLQPESTEVLNTIVLLHHTLYKDQGFAVIVITPEGEQYKEAAREYLRTHNRSWLTVTDYRDETGRRPVLMPYPYPNYLMLDKSGRVVIDNFNKGAGSVKDYFINFSGYASLYGISLGYFGKTTYESVDYGLDKKYVKLQGATRGNGIDLVFMGEGFVDVDIESGYYEMLIRESVEAFFSIEPTKSYREYFNVYMVYAVSRSPYFGGSDATALGSTYNSSKGRYDVSTVLCRIYAERCPLRNLYETSTTIISKESEGVCFIYPQGDTYAMVDYNSIVGLTLHESVGHGFGYLADEYYDYWATITESDKQTLKDYQSLYKRYLNVSVTDDPASVPWSHLIDHPNYPYVGIYEGGYYNHYGVWRSEVSNVMVRHVTRYFNAISRELIVRRILTLSGEGYTFEKFLEKDSDKERYSVSSLQNTSTDDMSYQHHPPVIIEE